MNDFKLIFTYSARLVYRQWRRFVLPFLSLVITAVVLCLILLLSNAAELLLAEQARELQGGDIVLESTNPINSADFWQAAAVTPTRESNQLSFQATLQSDEQTTPFSIQVVDSNFPLYGSVQLEEGKFLGVGSSEIYLDRVGAERLGVTLGDAVQFGTATFTVAGIITAEPTSLFVGFRFLPRAFLSTEGFAAATIDPQLLRVEYVYAGVFPDLTPEDKERVRQSEETFGATLDVDIAGQDRRGLQFGLQTVTDFLVVAVLITAVLAAVNVYASTLYLVTVERRSFAVLLALGLPKRLLSAVLGAALAHITLGASLLGVWLGSAVFTVLQQYIAQAFFITLPLPAVLVYGGICVALIAAIALASFIPAVRKSLALNPKQILIGGEEEGTGKLPLRSLAFITTATLLPLTFLASFLLGDVVDGVLVILVVATIYVTIAGCFSVVLDRLYRIRARFGFFIQSIISQKKADGLFGIVAFTSLFVALISLGTLTLLQLSLNNYLTNDLSLTVPSTYVIDIQPSQRDEVAERYPGLNLFSNVPARIVAIDGLRIQDELANGNEAIDRELGREFNLTARAELLSSEAIVAGTWSNGASGEISVDEDFAKQANIELGSKLSFTVQGFPIEGVVTSLRSTDSRSGLPFFYFVLAPEDLKDFPGVSFGYAYYEAEKQRELSRYLATAMPNVSVLETQTIGPLIVKLVGTLLTVVLIVSLPPLLIATLLIATLVVSSYASRRREGARLRSVGATRKMILIGYLAETISLTLVSAIVAYFISVLLAYSISVYFLGIESIVVFDLELVFGLGLIVILVGLIGLYLFKTDTMPLRELLSYESNS